MVGESRNKVGELTVFYRIHVRKAFSFPWSEVRESVFLHKYEGMNISFSNPAQLTDVVTGH